MVYCSTKGRAYHLPHCPVIRRIGQENIGSFDTVPEARRSGYRRCGCCSPVGHQLQRERQKLTGLCQAHRITFRLYDGQLSIYTPMSSWRIVVTGQDSPLELYHRNTWDLEGADSPVPKHHLQNTRSASIIGYINYIIRHDYYRMAHPLAPPPKPKEKPRKGTNRWKKQQKREKKKQKREAVDRV